MNATVYKIYGSEMKSGKQFYKETVIIGTPSVDRIISDYRKKGIKVTYVKKCEKLDCSPSEFFDELLEAYEMLEDN